MVHEEMDPLGQLHEREGTPRFGRLCADLGHLGVEVRQEIGGHLAVLDGFRDAVEEPGLEGYGGIRHTRPHAMGCRAVARARSVAASAVCCAAESVVNRRPLRATR